MDTKAIKRALLRLVIVISLILSSLGPTLADSSKSKPQLQAEAGPPPLKTEHPIGVAPLKIKPKPFWQKKKVLERILEEKAIMVSADVPKEEKGGDTSYELNFTAAGLVKAPLSFTQTTVWEFKNLPKVHDAFKEVKEFPDYQRVYLHIASYGFHARMILQLKKKENKGVHEMHWESVSGSFKGMTGVVRLDKHNSRSTLMSMTGHYRSKKLPLPRVLMGFGLEVVAQKVAGAMREYIEEEYKK